MDSDASENYEDLYEEKDARKHEKFVEKILSLHKSQHLKKPSRTEPTLQVSEFNLVKSITGNKGSVEIEELTKPLKDRKTRVRIGENVKKAQRSSQTLMKPMEKPQADRIRRGIAYEKTRLELDRWEATVTANRISNNLSFPLNNNVKMDKKESENFTSMWSVKSDLTKELEQLQPKVEEFRIDLEEEKFPLTMKEMLARRKEAAKLRAFQGYQEAKARRQNKIKSKKYHRVQKRERIKKQLKEFEHLQKTNPEEALKKLEEIEKARIEERFSLRHKSTGKWARNQQIRAKYDQESRQNLAQQLTLSRDLTQKTKTDGSSSDEEAEEVKTIPTTEENNPWINGVKPGQEVVDFIHGYRKYWSNQNENKTESPEIVETEKNQEPVKQNVSIQHDDNENKEENVNKKEKTVKETLKNQKEKLRTEQTPDLKKENDRKQKVTPKKKRQLNSTDDWDVSFVSNETNTVEKVKLSKKRRENEVDESKKEETRQDNEKTINQSSTNGNNETKEERKKFVQNVNNLKRQLNINPPSKQESNIDPEKYIKVKPTNLNTAIPNLVTEENGNNQLAVISEAFEDDDIITEFNQSKQNEIEKDKPKNIDLSLPGWGSWGGTGVQVNKRKKRRFTFKPPQKLPRRDDNKGFLIVNENAQEGIKKHKVSEVPFPFKTVKDFEASVRAPIGNTFVPETAFKKLIRPTVKTKMGTIIEPMRKSFLVNKTN